MEKPVEAEEIFEEASGDPEYQDVEASAHSEVPKYKDTEASSYPEVLEDQDVEAGAYSKVPEDQDAEESDHPEVPVAWARDYGNTHKISYYYTKMDIYVLNIDRNDKNTWRTIYKEIDAPYFGEV